MLQILWERTGPRKHHESSEDTRFTHVAKQIDYLRNFSSLAKLIQCNFYWCKLCKVIYHCGLTWMSLITKDLEQLSIYFLSFWIFFFWKLFMCIICSLFSWVFSFLLICRSSLYLPNVKFFFVSFDIVNIFNPDFYLFICSIFWTEILFM